MDYNPNEQKQAARAAEEDWYASAQAMAVERKTAEQTDELSRRRRKERWQGIGLLLLITVLVGALLAGGWFLARKFLHFSFSVMNNGEGFSFSTPGEGSDHSFGFSFGREDDRDESGFADDFKEYFSNYYTPYEQAEDCEIETVKVNDPPVMDLQPVGDEVLSYQEIYAKVAPSVVGITAYPEENSDDMYYWGTGVILSADGCIITNAHIVEGTCRAVITTWDDRELEAKLVGCDSRSDVAVLKVEGGDLVPAEFGDSATLQVGDEVAAIGNPLSSAFRATMTNGIISGIDRDVNYNGATVTLIQTNAALNEGNSGGALVNRCGQVIGITNMKMSNTYAGAVTIEGLGFAIPSVTVKEMTEGLLADGAVLGRPALGLTVGPVSDEAREHYGLPEGLYVSKVSEGSDCAAKGIREGDIITHVNGKPATVNDDLLEVIGELGVGDTLTLTIYRDGESTDYTVALVDMNDVY